MKKLIVANNEPGIYESLLSGEMALTFSLKITQPYKDWVDEVNMYVGNVPAYPAVLIATTKYIETLPALDSTVIIGNMCYSGATNDGKPFESDGASGGYMAICHRAGYKNQGAKQNTVFAS